MRERIVIIDDDIRQTEQLLRMIAEQFPELKVVSVFHSVEDAVSGIGKAQPDLVILDVMLEPGTGFDVLERIPERDFDVIFSTSHDSFMLRALHLSAIDYLLKPYGPDELGAAIRRFLERKSSADGRIDNLLRNSAQADQQKRLAVPTLTGYSFVQVSQIIRCEATKRYTVLYLEGGKQIANAKSVKEVEDLLGPYGFYRIHQSHLINLQKVLEYRKGDGGSVIMLDNTELEVSRRKKDDFIARLEKL
jgi:two-component system, LytTR family, response regulator